MKHEFKDTVERLSELAKSIDSQIDILKYRNLDIDQLLNVVDNSTAANNYVS